MSVLARANFYYVTVNVTLPFVIDDSYLAIMPSILSIRPCPTRSSSELSLDIVTPFYYSMFQIIG